MADGTPRMVFLGFGKYARSDRIYALEPLRGDERGGGRRTRVWVEGISEPVVASRTERTILLDMGVKADSVAPIVSEALQLAQRIVEDSERGRFDVGEYARRARHLLESTAQPEEASKLF